jgi:hypothetical protein
MHLGKDMTAVTDEQSTFEFDALGGGIRADGGFVG